MVQQFVYRVTGSVCRLESPPASRAPSGVVRGSVPLEHDLNLFPRRNLRCDLGRNDNLTVRREFASEVSGLHLCSLTLYIITRVRDSGLPHTLRVLSSDSEGYVVNWFEAARGRIGGPGEFPLIDDEEIVEEKAVSDHWPSFFEGSERDVDRLRQEALTVDHLDLPVRFVYLNIFYRLAHYPGEQVAVVVEDQNSAAVHRDDFEHDLEALVRLVDVESAGRLQRIELERLGDMNNRVKHKREPALTWKDAEDMARLSREVLDVILSM